VGTKGLAALVVCLLGSFSAPARAQGGLLGSQSPEQAPLPPPLPWDPTLEVPPPGEKDFSEFEEGTVGPAPGAPTLNLSRAVSLALERNLGILSAADAVSSARYREGAARAQFLPQITPHYEHSSESRDFSLNLFERLPWSGASLSASGELRSTPSSPIPFTRSSDFRVLLSQPLLRGFGPNATFFDLTNSRRGRQGQERTFELSRQTLAVDVTSAFYQIVKQRQLLGVAQQSLKRSSGLKDASEARMRVGLASKLDVFRAELQASQAQEAMVAAQAALETALEQFRVLLGLPPTNPVEPEAVTLPETLDEGDEALDVLVARALSSRLELREGRDQVNDGRRAASLARQNLLPELDLNLDVSQVGFGPTLSDSIRSGDRKVTVFLSTTYPLERSADRASAAIAELDLESRTRALKQQEMNVEAEVRAAVRNLGRIRKSVDLQRKGVEFAAQQHRLATLRYQRGLASNFDVVDAEGSLVAARTALVNLVTDYEVARVQLLKATGTLDLATEFGP
jgi:outer membrane protein